MKFTKTWFYIFLHIVFIGLILLYQSIWFYKSNTTEGKVLILTKMAPKGEKKNIQTIVIRYVVGNTIYDKPYTTDILRDKIVRMRYLTFAPDWSRPDTFIGNWLTLLVVYFVFFLFTSITLLIDNDLMPGGTRIAFRRRKPWVEILFPIQQATSGSSLK